LAGIALTTDTILTSIGNDMSATASLRQVEALGRSDVALGISTSGMSPNVAAGSSRRAASVAHGGADRPRQGDVGRVSEIHINVPAQSTARVRKCTARSCTSFAISSSGRWPRFRAV
jgi:phosphoheptose isomerase